MRYALHALVTIDGVPDCSSAITDGEPTGEDRKMMNRVITKIHNELQGTKYTPDAVSFMFS